jgi:L-threonylcarbamoyladenylate synthase
MSDIVEAAATLRGGGLVVYPTESVYGMGTALSAGEAGVARVRTAKGSPKGRPFLLLVADTEAAFALWSEVPDSGRSLAESAWPAPLTLIGPAREGLPPGLVGEGPGGQPTVAVRVPSNPWLLSLLVELGEPLLSSSANLAGDPAPVHFREIPLGALAPDLAIDCGSCAALGPSTLVSCLGEEPIILRQGAYHFSAV